MAWNEVNIYNRALNAVGQRDVVSAPDELSREAEVCRLWFQPVRDQVLRAAPWPFAKKTKRLALLVERDWEEDWTSLSPDPEYQFAYSLPSDYIHARFLSSFQPFSISVYNEQTRSLMANVEDAIFTYTRRVENIALWDEDFAMAVTFGLANAIAMPLSAKPARAQKMMEQANQLIITARVNAANEENVNYESIPPWLIARGYSGGMEPTRYIYPVGNLLSPVGYVS